MRIGNLINITPPEDYRPHLHISEGLLKPCGTSILQYTLDSTPAFLSHPRVLCVERVPYALCDLNIVLFFTAESTR